MAELNNRKLAFAREYVKDWNGTQAAIRAGYNVAGAAVEASRLLKNPKIVSIIEQYKEEAAIAAKLTPTWVLKRWMAIAGADPAELMQLRRVACRHCHGVEHQYQWTQAEYTKAVNDAIEYGKNHPDGTGGFGYDPTAAPHKDCPECGGLGVEYVHISDTRKLKGDAKFLYAGVQKTKEGLKVLTRDQDAALANLAKYLGMMIDKKEITGANGGPIATVTLKPEDLTDEQLAAILSVQEDDADEA